MVTHLLQNNTIFIFYLVKNIEALYKLYKMDCEVTQHNNHTCGRPTYKNEIYCYVHLRKWLQLRLKSFGIVIKFPRKTEEIEKGLTLLKETDPTYADKYGFNIIHRGVMALDIPMIKQGIKIGLNINGRTFLNLYTPLHFARSHIPNIISLLLRAGANINLRDIYGYTLLSKEKDNILFYRKVAITRNNDDMLKTIRKNCNLLMLPYFWETQTCIKWRESIIY